MVTNGNGLSLNTEVLIEIPNCIVCNSKDRKEIVGGIAASQYGGLGYIKKTANRIGISHQELFDKIKWYQCNNCNNYWCDPWLDIFSSSKIFSSDYPDHMAAWSFFEHWLSHPKLNAGPLAPLSLYNFLQKRIGKIKSYAEYGCPFTGFLLH